VKFSYNWLAELVVGLQEDPRKIAGLITMKTAESEGVEHVGEHLTEVSLAKVESVEPIGGGPNQKVEINTQRFGRKTVVCGAPNVRPGLLTVYIPSGTRLGGQTIGTRTIGGVTSEGMLVSGAELGLNRDADGILEMGKTSNRGLLACLPDWIIEIDNKSLNHRPDLWGHLGLAREVAAWSELALRDPVDVSKFPGELSPLRISIEDDDLCPRYSGLVLENVTVQPSPLWMQYRLKSIGINPINNVVDVTNYVMAELAQPMHAFDRAKVHEDTIVVRRAREGERIAALNEEAYTLTPEMLVIADPEGAIAIAGVIGGLETGIAGDTTEIILESANFQAANIRRTSSRLKLRTDASMRFEKAQDPANTVRGLARALQLLSQMMPEMRVVGGVADAHRQTAPPPPIELPLDWLERKLGTRVEDEQVSSILRRLHFGVRETGHRKLLVEVPSWRATRDISIKDDLVEEIGRIIGYGAITPKAPAFPAAVPPINEERRYFRQVRHTLAAAGFTEVYNYSFLSDEQAAAFGLDPAELLAVDNPIAAGQNYMRSTLVPGIRKNILDNARHFDSFRLFEIGVEIHERPEGLPDEVPHLAAAIFAKDDGRAGLFELERVADCLIPGAEVRPAEGRPYEHPARAAELWWHGEPVGRLFELHPSMAPGRAAILDLDLAAVRRLEPGIRRYRPIRRFPASAFDLSVLAARRDLAADLEARLKTLAGERLEKIEFLRQYEGPPIPEGRKSVSYRLTLAAPDRTLSLEETGEIRNRIIEGMKAQGYELRL
jgi:phenylalanyl-tRNA synthetase beta chain